MVSPAAGAVVLVRFPFSDLSATKLRPAVVVAPAGRDDWILCQVTSRAYADATAVELTDEHFERGSLRRVSYARPGKLFTANASLMTTDVGCLAEEPFNALRAAIVAVIRGEPDDAMTDDAEGAEEAG